MSTPLRRRHSAVVAAVVSTTLLFAACSFTPTGTSSGGAGSSTATPVTLRMVWWGNDTRAKATQKAIALFEAAHPGITVEAESLPYDGYHDKLATQTAANDAPDVQQLQGEFMAQFAGQGALAPMPAVNVSDLDPGTTANGNRNGGQLAVAAGLSTLVMVANPKVFDQAGVPLPDDTTWTWEDFARIAKQITDKSPDGVFGAKSVGWDVIEAASWVSQLGGELFTEDGKLGAKADNFVALFDLAKQMMDEGGSPSASETAEQLTLAPQESGVATNRYGMQADAASNFPALDAAYGGGLKMLRLPSQPGAPGQHHMMFVAGQYWGVSARTQHPAEAQMLVDFLVNDIEAGKVLGVTRGTPNNSTVRAAVVPTVRETDQAVPSFMAKIAAEIVPSYRLTAGTSSFTANLQRYTGEVLFGRMTSQKAAEGLIAETEASIKAAA